MPLVRTTKHSSRIKLSVNPNKRMIRQLRERTRRLLQEIIMKRKKLI
jgi:hypothetical protein